MQLSLIIIIIIIIIGLLRNEVADGLGQHCVKSVRIHVGQILGASYPLPFLVSLGEGAAELFARVTSPSKRVPKECPPRFLSSLLKSVSLTQKPSLPPKTLPPQPWPPAAPSRRRFSGDRGAACGEAATVEAFVRTGPSASATPNGGHQRRLPFDDSPEAEAPPAARGGNGGRFPSTG